MRAERLGREDEKKGAPQGPVQGEGPALSRLAAILRIAWIDASALAGAVAAMLPLLADRRPVGRPVEPEAAPDTDPEPDADAPAP